MEAWDSEYKGSGGICVIMIDGFTTQLDSEFAKRRFSLIYFVINVLQLFPFLMFFLLDQPHDCFVCLGKDPDRIYSRFQLTPAERLKRKMFVKYSM